MIGNNVIILEHIYSTNDYASDLLDKQQPPEGTVIIAHYQQQGKGQREAVWESEAGKNLLCSIILYPTFLTVTNQFLLNQVISLAVSAIVFELSGVQPSIKWPNDILVHEKKISGILIQNSLKSNLIQASVVGIGLNINQLIFMNHAYAAVSLASLAGKTFDLEVCGKLLFEKVDFYYDLLRKNNLIQLNELYLERLFRLNVPSMFEINGKTAKATIRGVKSEGDLILEMEDGQARYIRSKEVKYLF